MEIGIKLDEGALVPRKAHQEDAGFDLYSPVDKYINYGSYAVIDTGVHFDIPNGWCGLLVSKSGLYFKNGLKTTGLIDSGYTGSVHVRIDNPVSSGPYIVSSGDKISQIIFLPVPEVSLVLRDMPETERGDNGFGSTGR